MTAREEDVKKWARKYDAFLEEEAKADHNAALLKGIRLGLEAAARAVDAGAKDWHADIPWIDIDYPSEHHPVVDTIRALRTEANAIRALDPETIAKEAAPPVRKDHRADAAADAFYVEEADQ